MLIERVDEPEWMDDPDLTRERMRRVAQDLRRLNQWFGGARAITRPLLRRCVDGRSISVLDVGGGDGYVLGQVMEAGRRRQIEVRGTVLEQSAVMVGLAGERAAASPGMRVVAGDALTLPYKDGSFDFVVSCLVLHHLGDAGAARALSEMWRVARRGVVVSDLVRSRIALMAVRAALPLLARDPITRHDGPASIRRAFTMEEWRAIAGRSGVFGLECRPSSWFRVTLIADRQS